MISYADTFFKTKVGCFAYYPKRKCVHLLTVNEKNIKKTIKHLLKIKDNLTPHLLESNLLLQKIEIEEIIFESKFKEQRPGTVEFHEKILDGEEKIIVDTITKFLGLSETPFPKCAENPFYYACGMGVFWSVKIKNTFTLIKDKTDEEFKIREYPELKKFLESYEKYYLEEGYFDYRSHHGFKDKLTSKIQKRCFKIYLKVGFSRDLFPKKEIYYDDDKYYVNYKRQLEILEDELIKRKEFIKKLEKFENIEILCSDSSCFLIIVK